jgi:hypothetical protein
MKKKQQSHNPLSVNKDKSRNQLEKIITNNPMQTEKEIFSNYNSEGFNQNPSEQQNYPGVQQKGQLKK